MNDARSQARGGILNFYRLVDEKCKEGLEKLGEKERKKLGNILYVGLCFKNFNTSDHRFLVTYAPNYDNAIKLVQPAVPNVPELEVCKLRVKSENGEFSENSTFGPAKAREISSGVYPAFNISEECYDIFEQELLPYFVVDKKGRLTYCSPAKGIVDAACKKAGLRPNYIAKSVTGGSRMDKGRAGRIRAAL